MDSALTSAAPQSRDHVAFATGSAGLVEFFERDGSIYRAPASACIMPDGYRCGRWECSTAHWVNNYALLLGAFDSYTIGAGA